MHPKIQCVRKFNVYENSTDKLNWQKLHQKSIASQRQFKGIRNQSKIRKGRNLTQIENSNKKKGQVIRKLD